MSKTTPVRWQDAKTTPLEDLLRAMADMVLRQRERPPMTTEDGLRQIAATASDAESRAAARRELRRRRRGMARP